MSDAGTLHSVEMAEKASLLHPHDDTKVVQVATTGHHAHDEGLPAGEGLHASHSHHEHGHSHGEHGHSHGEHGHSHGGHGHSHGGHSPGHAHPHGHTEDLCGHHGHGDEPQSVLFLGRVDGLPGHHGHHEGLHGLVVGPPADGHHHGPGHHGHGLYGGHEPAGMHVHAHDHTHVHHGHGDEHERGGAHGVAQGKYKSGKYRLQTPNGILKVRIYDKHQTPPEFRIKFKDWQGAHPAAGSVSLQTQSGEGAYETYVFTDADGYLKATRTIPAPQDFHGEVSIVGHPRTYGFEQSEAGHAATHKHKPSIFGLLFRFF